MDKNFLQDVVPPARKRTIRNIPVPEGRRRNHHSHDSDSDVNINRINNKAESYGYDQNDQSTEYRHIHPRDTSENPRPPRNHYKAKRRNKKYIWTVVIVVLIFLILTIFSSGEVIIQSKTATASVDSTIYLSPEKTEGYLTYTKIDATDTSSKVIEASGSENVSEKASGEITIFNEYSSEPQKLIKNTRFESPEGLIYRIGESVTVPGKNGNKPGTLDVVVVADEPGEDYNINSATFTIPGFSGLPQFDSFYAKTKTSINGGFEGVRPVIADSDLNTTESELENVVKESLLNKARLQSNGDDSVILYNSKDFNFSTKQEPDGDSKAKITLTGVLSTYAVDIHEISMLVASEVLVDYDLSEAVVIENLDSLELETVTEDDEILINIKGQPEFKWITDEEKLKESVAGEKKEDLKRLLASYPSITRAEAVLKPFWKKSFPSKPSRVKITQVDDLEKSE